MQKLLNYPIIGLIIILLLLIIYTSIIKNQRDKIRNELNQAEQQIDQLVQVNKNLNGAIDLLEKQAQQNRNYINDLEQKRLATQQQAKQLTQQFKRQQHEDKTIYNWANQPIPDSLY
ncbi:hypothetical protein MTZ49_09140 [Entomomonas sp. E2T0]|uniref:hypothetical protein n=1 Tax=Entomomonas sp. E2T0 TaxID=2930213 RepID=UPI002228312B|nr:hypothetical protein [Entomomonas sp. E2T0]UYZ82777.1 hypothetical protein MTZ49_09140 [Entomomonas sp. E2T0]